MTCVYYSLALRLLDNGPRLFWFLQTLKVVVKRRMKKILPYIKLFCHQTARMSALRKVRE
jgi:hypothetical protein